MSVIGGPSTYDPEEYDRRRQELVKFVPNSQDELPPRRMIDSFDSAIIPLGSDERIRDRYATHLGGVRIGTYHLFVLIWVSLCFRQAVQLRHCLHLRWLWHSPTAETSAISQPQ